MAALRAINLVLRGIMEAAIVFALAYWGYHLGKRTGLKILYSIGIPLIGFGFWGLVDFHQLGRYAEPLRLLQEMLVSLLAAFLLFKTGLHVWGLLLAILSVIHHALLYLTGDRLVKNRT